MASLKDSLLDGISGKLDKYIIYRVGNETFIRRRPKKVSNPKSEKQQMQRAKLSTRSTRSSHNSNSSNRNSRSWQWAAGAPVPRRGSRR